MRCKICGVSDLNTLNYITEHPFKPDMIGFIVNYPKSKRYIELNKLKDLIRVNRNKISFVAVMVNPSEVFIKKLMKFKFDFFQLYDVSPAKTIKIKKKFKTKIITAITVKKKNDVKKYLLYKNISDILLFDSKGYEKSLSFNHELIKNVHANSNIMLAGNIKYNDKLEKFVKIADIIDISGGLETSGKKDKNKINIFLKNVRKL
tara:strand:+ start:310 stop:921 length:612 start_codon:yes stop_codon:yes gene_type:complete